MSATDSFLQYWWFHLPNLLMAAMIYTLVGRYALELIFASKPDVVILKVFRSVTDPVVNLVRFLTPRIVPDGVVVVFAILWLFALRMFWFLNAVALGMKVGGGT
jgi:YggT family protein